MENRIAEMRKRAGMTQKQLADALKTSQQNVWYYENGSRDIKASVLMDLSRVLDCTISELLNLADDPTIMTPRPTERRSLPIVGRCAAGEAREAIEQRDRTFPIAADLWDWNRNSFWVEVSGNSMNRVVLDRHLALVNPDEEVKNGDVAAVFVNGDEVTIKRVFFKDGGVLLAPDSYDPEYRDRFISSSDPDAPEVHIAGKVVATSSPEGWRA